jgi:NAD(P)-dependent dehydrogenase (short-subunit alcohol dehydrogenase family)
MAKNEFSLDGSVAVVTASGSAWLADMALALAEVGARVVLTGGPESEISAAALAVQQTGGEAVAVPANLVSERDVAKMVRRILKDMGSIGVLINTLNFEFWKPLLEITTKEWKHVYNTNVIANFLCTRQIGKHMVAKKKGSIVNVTSGLAQRGLSNGAAYCASMGSVLQMTRALALEWANQQVRVNAVGVGWLQGPTKTEGKDPLIGYIPMRRRAVLEDIIPLIIFLASEASSYLSGSIYMVDGGLMARG